MLFLYIYHIWRRRTWTEEQRGRRTWTWRLCCCIVPWRRGAAAWAHGARGMHSTGLYQQNCNGARAICFAWLMLADFLVFFLFNSCLFALPCRGVFALPCWAKNVDRATNKPATPQPPPQSRSPRRAELSWRVRNVSVRMQARVRIVGLHGGWQPQKKRRGMFFGDRNLAG